MFLSSYAAEEYQIHASRHPDAVSTLNAATPHCLHISSPSAVNHRFAPSALPHFLPLFLMPCWPVFIGPCSKINICSSLPRGSRCESLTLPDAFLAISSLAFLSVTSSHQPPTPLIRRLSRVPAANFSLCALSSSSSSLAAFFGFLLWMGLVPAVLASQ